MLCAWEVKPLRPQLDALDIKVWCMMSELPGYRPREREKRMQEQGGEQGGALFGCNCTSSQQLQSFWSKYLINYAKNSQHPQQISI